MRTPKLTQVTYHPAYASKRSDGSHLYFSASMTALDSTGKVWRAFQSADGDWRPWTPVDTFHL